MYKHSDGYFNECGECGREIDCDWRELCWTCYRKLHAEGKYRSKKPLNPTGHYRHTCIYRNGVRYEEINGVEVSTLWKQRTVYTQ
jgi:hypothetical protein